MPGTGSLPANAMKKNLSKPFVTVEKRIPEFTLRATFLGLILGFFFAIGNAYLALKTGTTVSASLPAAIISMGVLRIIFKNITILENNIVQTIATVGEGVAAGVAFTIPALLFLGETPSIARTMILSLLGGLLGILLMIPMRRQLIVKEDQVLPFPEGRACAEILKAGEAHSTKTAILALWGFLAGTFYRSAIDVFHWWQETSTWVFRSFHNSYWSIDTAPALMGVGYLMGFRIAGPMMAGGALGWWVIIPLIQTFAGEMVLYPSSIPLNQMAPEDLWSNYVRYIGAGALTISGMLSLFHIFPMLFKTFHAGCKELFSGLHEPQLFHRTDRDISLRWLILGPLAIIFALWLLPITSFDLFTVTLLVLLSFFFVAVTSITVGMIGSTSSPASGMTITILLIVCFLFLSLGWTERVHLVAAVSVGCVANIAIAMAGTTSQDLKTGFLVGATPRAQQIAEIVGLLIPSLSLGMIIALFNKLYVIGSSSMPAPQAALVSMIVNGVISQNLPYSLIVIGVVLGLILKFLRLSALPIALGLYLPLSLSSGIMVGGLISWYFKEHLKEKDALGILIASGLVGGDACSSILVAILTITGIVTATAQPTLPPIFSVIFYALFAMGFVFLVKKPLKIVSL